MCERKMSKDIDQKENKKPKTRNFKNTTNRLRKGNERHLSNRICLEWDLDNQLVSEPYEDIVEHADLDEIKEILSQSQTGKALLENAKGINIHFDPQISVSQYYPREKVITLNSNFPKAEMVQLLARELRFVWQKKEENLINPLDYDPEEAILVNRAQRADALMVSVKIAWELKLNGENLIWDHMIRSPLSDMTRVFEIHAQADFRSLNNGEASRAVYDKWFEDNRTKAHDKRIIHQMLLDDTRQALVENKGQKKTIYDALSKLGKMPFGENYMNVSNSRHPADPLYGVIEDRSNANFLWFIKFERNFQEKERQMLETSIEKSAEIINFSQRAKERTKKDEMHI